MNMEPDRDRPFDNLLHDALMRQSAEAGAHLDADTAAAWADGALDAAARGLAEQHVAGCARCQVTKLTPSMTSDHEPVP